MWEFAKLLRSSPHFGGGKSQRLDVQPFPIWHSLRSGTSVEFFGRRSPTTKQRQCLQGRLSYKNRAGQSFSGKIPSLRLVCLDLYDRTGDRHLSHQEMQGNDLNFSIDPGCHSEQDKRESEDLNPCPLRSFKIHQS